MSEWLTQHARRTPHKALLETPHSVWSYSQAHQEIETRKREYRALGVGTGQRVAIPAGDVPAVWFSFLALSALGAVPVICSPSLANTPILKSLLSQPSVGEGVILFTSGSSGEPKAVLLKPNSLFENASLQNDLVSFTEHSRVLLCGQPWFTSPLIHFLATLQAGATAVVEVPPVFPDSFFLRLEEKQISAVASAPALVQRALVAEAPLPACVQTWISSGEKLLQTNAQRFLSRFPRVSLFTFYGMTELAGRIVGQRAQFETCGAVGRVLGDTRLSFSSEGEILIQSSLLMLGYFTVEGYCPVREPFATGDLGHQEGRDLICLESRRDRVFKSGAVKISPQLIEEIAAAHPSVFEVRVDRFEDPFLGTVPALWFSVRPGGELSPLELSGWLSSRLERELLPKRVFLLDALPRAESGKISRTDKKVLITPL